MNREETVKLLNRMSALYPNFKPTNPHATVEIWQEMFNDVPYEQVDTALKMYARTDRSGFAPTISQLIGVVMDAVEAQVAGNEIEAWTLVMKAVRNGVYNAESEFAKLPPLVQKAVGSASQIRNWATDDNFNETVAQSLFQRTYNTELKRAKTVGMGGEFAQLASSTLARLEG